MSIPSMMNAWPSTCTHNVVFFSLLSLKVLNSIVLLGKSADFIHENKDQPATSPDPHRTMPRSHSFTSIHFSTKQPCTDDMALDSALRQKMKRSQSLGSSINSAPDSPTGGAPVSPGKDESLKPLFSSNSTVSLQSVGLNEEYIKDRDTGAGSQPTSLTQRTNTTKKPQKPLSEIDRYTMCSNRII